MKKIALFGASFNPAHSAHFEMGSYLHDILKVDEVWFLLSLNWQKDASKYASLNHRMAMANIMRRNYPDKSFVISNIQEEIGTHVTYDVLKELQKRFSDHHFIWTMGADNLADFNTWQNFEKIIEEFPIAIVDRPHYTEKAQQSYTALTYAHLKTAEPADLAKNTNGWCFLNNPKIDMSSSDLLKQLQAGKKTFPGFFQQIANYIYEHGLYGTNIKVTPQATQPDHTYC